MRKSKPLHYHESAQGSLGGQQVCRESRWAIGSIVIAYSLVLACYDKPGLKWPGIIIAVLAAISGGSRFISKF